MTFFGITKMGTIERDENKRNLYCQLLQLSKLPLHMFIFRQICFVSYSQLLNGQLIVNWTTFIYQFFL